ncbi:uncharacterized protein LOC144420852 [Styela clava]
MTEYEESSVDKLEAQVHMMQYQRLPYSLLNYYTVDGQLADGKLLAECKTCFAKCRYSPNVTSNLVTHLRNRHPHKHAEYEANRPTKVGQRRRLRKSNSIEIQSTFTIIKETQNPEEIRKLRITKKLVSTIAYDCLPINIVESPFFRDLFYEMDQNYIMPSAESMKNCLLPEYASRMEISLRKELETYSRLYLTVDMWTKPRITSNVVSFLGVTVHFINDDWELKSRALGCSFFEGEVKVSAIVSAYENVVDRYNLRGKVRKLFVDNAASMEMALDTSFPGFHSENINQINTTGRIFDCDIAFRDAGNALPDGNSFRQAQLLCVRDGLMHPEVQGSSMTFTLLKVSTLINSLSASQIGHAFIQERGIYLKVKNEVKWMAQIKTLSSIVENPNEFNVAVNLLNAKSRDNQLNTSEILVLRELLLIMEPFMEALESGDSDSQISISAIGPIICGLKQSLQSILDVGLKHCAKLAGVLLDAVTTRLDPFLDCDDVKFASFLDPRFKLEWIQSPLTRDQLLTNLRSTLRTELGVQKNTSEIMKLNETQHLNEISIQSPKRPRLFSCLFSNSRRGQDENDFVSKCVDEYVKESVVPFHNDLLNYWKNSPKSLQPLKNMARDILPCSTSLSYSRRIFNIAKNYCSNMSGNADAETVRLLIFLKCNHELMEKL